MRWEETAETETKTRFRRTSGVRRTFVLADLALALENVIDIVRGAMLDRKIVHAGNTADRLGRGGRRDRRCK